MEMERKRVSLAFETKSIDEQGQFTGYAAVYGNVDLGGDIIEPGAFKKTLERNWRAPVMHEHKTAVGAASLEDSEYGLKAHGKLNLDKQAGRDAYSDLKFYKAEGIDTGMSIGYLPVPGKIGRKGNARSLQELKLFEVTLTLMPMNEKAGILNFKSIDEQFDENIEFWDRLKHELKSGRAISRTRAERIQTAANDLLSLLTEAGAIERATSEGADDLTSEPIVDHSELMSAKSIDSILALIPR